MKPSNELTNAPKASHLSSLKKKRIIRNAAQPSTDKNQHVLSSALFRPSIISPKNAIDSPMSKEMLAYGKIVNMAVQGHFTEDKIEAMDEQHRTKMEQCKKYGYVMIFGTKLSADRK